MRALNAMADIASAGLRAWRTQACAPGALAILLCNAGTTADTPTPPGVAAPTPAAQVGYTTHTFSANFTQATVDTAATEKRGFKWYNWDLFGSRSNSSGIVLNPDGSVTLNGQTGGADGQLVSAVQGRAGAAFVGNSFGGGAYIEAVLKWQPLRGSSTNVPAWPAFWALALEGHVSPYSSQWPGQPTGFVHDIETDFFEALPDDAGKNVYGGSLHDWYGIYQKTCAPEQMCQAKMPHWTGQRPAPAGTDFGQYHHYGFLWVPATTKNKGYAQYFFDGVQIGYTYQWNRVTDQPPPPTNQDWAFGILDQSHLFLILGTGQSQPTTVKSVDVWQAGTSANMTNN